MCGHIRMGTNPTNPLDTMVLHDIADLPAVCKFLKNQTQQHAHQGERTRIYLISDSDLVKDLARKEPEIGDLLALTPASFGPTLHVDKPEEDVSYDVTCRGWEKLIFEQLVLSSSKNYDVLLTTKSSVGLRRT